MPSRDELPGSAQAPTAKRDAMTLARRAILAYLAREGAAEVRELPRAWPVRRHHVQHIVLHLIADGLAETRDGNRFVHARSSVRLTAAGRASLRRLGNLVAVAAVPLPRSA